MATLRTAVSAASRHARPFASKVAVRSFSGALNRCKKVPATVSSLPTQAFAAARFSSSSTDDFVLSHPSTVEGPNPTRGRVIVITSGKGGVGKTTSAASFAHGLASRGHKTCVVDFDIGLRNLDIHLGMERRVIFDFVNVLMEECALNQALIKDKKQKNLFMLAASQTRDKDILTVDGVENVLAGLADAFDFVVLDSPAGIESGARHAMYFADDAIIVSNPELSSCRDADKMVGFISSRSRRAELGDVSPVSQTLLITRYDAARAEAEESLTISDMNELLGLDVVGVIPESKDVLTCTNLGTPIITLEDNDAAGAYDDMVDRYLGEEKELRFVTPEPVSFFKKVFG